MDEIRMLLESQALFTLFLTVALGYLVGEISLKGFSMGSGAVLFVGLAIGGFAPKAAPPALVGTLGLLLFLYGVGIQYGPQFFRGLTSPEGLKANLAALCGVIVAGLLALALVPLFGLKLDAALGIFAGSGTSTATLQAILAATRGEDAAVGYSVAYPFGVALPILCIHLINTWLKPKIDAPAAQLIETAEIALRNPDLIGRSFAELRDRLPNGVAIAAIRQEQHNRIAEDGMILQADDVLLATATNPSLLRAATRQLGELQPGSMTSHREDLDYFRIFVSSRAVIGQRLGNIAFPPGVDCAVVHVRRGDIDLLPQSELILEVGDRVGVFVHRSHAHAVQKLFGNSIKSTADLSFIALGLGAALGLLIGLIPIVIPGVGKFTLGLAALLLLALYLGKLHRSGPLVWSMPLSANLVLRNFGLTVFLAQVGLSSGPKFFATVGSSGISMLLYSIVIVLALVIITAVFCSLVFRLPFDSTAGVISGATGNPAILAFASRTIPTDRPDIGYAMIFPSMTVGKILFVQIAVVLLGAG